MTPRIAVKTFDLLDFTRDLHKTIVLECGQDILDWALNNPPKPRTSDFAKVVDILVAFVAGKQKRQESAIRLMAKHLQFVTTAVLQEMRRAMTKKDHPLTLDMLGNLPGDSCAFYGEIILGDTADGFKMTGEQVGAAHNLLNWAGILYEGGSDELYHTTGTLRAALEFRFGEVDLKVLSRTNWVGTYNPRREGRRPQQQQQYHDQRQQQEPDQQESQGTAFGAVLKAAVAPVPAAAPVDTSNLVIITEDPAEQARLMEAAMEQLDQNDPATIDLMIAAKGDGNNSTDDASPEVFAVDSNNATTELLASETEQVEEPVTIEAVADNAQPVDGLAQIPMELMAAVAANLAAEPVPAE